MATTATEVVVELKQAPPVVFDEPAAPHGNYVRFRLSPKVSIAIGARTKRPGEEMVGAPVELSVVHEPGHGRMAAYERLIGDAMDGEATLFARRDVVEAAWAIVDPILRAEGPVHEYDCGSWGRGRRTRWWRRWGGGTIPTEHARGDLSSGTARDQSSTSRMEGPFANWAVANGDVSMNFVLLPRNQSTAASINLNIIVR